MWQDGLAGRLRRDVSLKLLTTVRVGGTARFLVEPRSAAEVGELLAALAAEDLPYRVLGGGSNLLAPDGVVEEVVIHPRLLRTFRVEGRRIRLGAGVPTSRLVSGAGEAGLAGAHVLAGIPGQVGGALVMNAGTRYGEISELVESVEIRLPGGAREVLAAADVGYGYRRSAFPPGAVITGAVLRLTPARDRAALMRTAARLVRERNAAQPTSAWSFGCMFKNPPGESAGRLVERVGLKGEVCGGARISPRHANFVENLGEASAADILALIRRAEARVLEHSGVQLQREVHVWGAAC